MTTSGGTMTRGLQLILWTLPLLCPAVTAAPAAPKPAQKTTLSQYVHAQLAATLDALSSGGDYDAAETSANQLFDLTAALAPDSALDAFRDADFLRRLVTQLEKVAPQRRANILKYLRANETLARTLVFLIHDDHEKKADVYACLARLIDQRPELLDQYANLTAAICVVHDRPLKRQINENHAKAPDALEIFDYYVKNEPKMFFGIRNVPAELLVHVVDTTASIDEMNWALSKYAGDKAVGKRFFDIKYDMDNFRNGTPKKITTEGFTLPNILQYGGVCADQAYFASGVGKAIGVPTAYAVGNSAETGHAWVGFLEAQGNRGWWNFNTGRYESYQGVKGTVTDPQTRQQIPDSYVSLQAKMIGSKPADRQAAVALTDAAHRLIAWEKDTPKAAPALPDAISPSTALRVPRKADTAAALVLIELALRQNAGYAPAWFTIRDLAEAQKLKLPDKKRWAGVLQKLGAQRYPDFTLAILAPMIETVANTKEQDQLWESAFAMVQHRFDLAASVRMHQAALWESAAEPTKAGRCYMDVIDRYANAGPFVIEALKKAAALLRGSGHPDKVLQLYDQTFSRITRPEDMAPDAMKQSNWYRVGQLYLKELESAGQQAKADAIRSEMGLKFAAHP